MTKAALTPEDAQKLIEAVIGGTDNPKFATEKMMPGDIALVFREGGGTEILSLIDPNAVQGAEQMGSIAMRGTVATALWKIAHDIPLMTTILTEVTKEWAENPPTKRLDS